MQTRAPQTIQIVSSVDELDRWDAAWRALAEERGNPFVTPDWYRSWLEHYGHDAEPFVVISGADDGSCDGVLPLVRTDRAVLRFAGADLGDQFHPACREEDELDFTRRACRILREHSDRWSTAVLHGTETGSDWLAGLRVGTGPLSVVAGKATAMPYVDLGGLDWETFWTARGRKLRKYVRSRLNKLNAEHTVTFRRTQHADALAADMATLLDLHARRFGHTSLLSDTNAQAFHRSFAAAALEQGWLRLTFMEIDGTPVAASYGWNLGGRYGDYNGGFDPRWAKTSVGLLLMVHTLRSAIDEGATEYDFLLGDEPYKSRFTDDRRNVATVLAGPRFHPHTLAFAAQVKVHGLSDRLPGSARERLRRSLHPLLRRLPTTRST